MMRGLEACRASETARRHSQPAQTTPDIRSQGGKTAETGESDSARKPFLADLHHDNPLLPTGSRRFQPEIPQQLSTRSKKPATVAAAKSAIFGLGSDAGNG